MNQLLRTTLYSIAILLIGTAYAQPIPPYSIIITGQVAGCTPNSQVYVESNEINSGISALLDANCNYFVVLDVQTLNPTILVYTPCNGMNFADTLNVVIDPVFPDSTILTVNLDCNGSFVTDCEGVVNGPAMPGTACVTALNEPGIYAANCFCEAISSNCNACFYVTQAATPINEPIPFTALFTNCSSGGVQPYTFSWSLDGGVTYEMGVADSALVFTEGTHFICMDLTDAIGCVSTFCDSLIVDANGTINPSSSYVDCLGVTNGPNTPGTPCDLGSNELGTWDINCVCQDDSSTACMAGFIAIQAFTYADSTGGNPGGIEPIPNEVWIWNQSTGTGNIAYTWDFGDGSLSTDPFPTHIYANGGPYLLCLTMTDDANCISIFCDTLSVDTDGLLNGMIVRDEERAAFTLNVIQELPTTINETERFEAIALWPNPVNDAITLSLSSTATGRMDISILDVNGRLLSTTNNSLNAGKNNLTIPVTELESGMYIIRLSDGKTITSRRFVKQ